MRHEFVTPSQTVPKKHGKKRAEGRKGSKRRGKDNDAPPSSQPTRHTTTSNRHQFTKTFLDLPAELRNEIYMLSLPENEVIDVAHGMPSVLFAHDQVFKEASPIFLSRNAFTTHVKDRNDAALTGWLDFVKALPEEHKVSIPQLTIAFEGEIFEFIGGKREWGYDPDFDYWNALVVQIRDAGLTANQLTFPGLQPELFAKLPFDSSRDAIVAKALLNRHVLTPLLRHHDLLDPGKPPVNVREQVSVGFQDLGLTRPQRSTIVLDWLSRRTFRGGKADPKRCFAYWVAEGEAAKTDLRKAWREHA